MSTVVHNYNLSSLCPELPGLLREDICEVRQGMEVHAPLPCLVSDHSDLTPCFPLPPGDLSSSSEPQAFSQYAFINMIPINVSVPHINSSAQLPSGGDLLNEQPIKM